MTRGVGGQSIVASSAPVVVKVMTAMTCLFKAVPFDVQAVSHRAHLSAGVPEIAHYRAVIVSMMLILLLADRLGRSQLLRSRMSQF